MKPAYVYILRSLKNNSFYIGSTNCPERRLFEHNSGKSKYTKNNRPFVLVITQQYCNLKEARKIEYKLKRLANRKIIEQIITDKRIKLSIAG